MPSQMYSERVVTCKQFKNRHAEQLKLVSSFEWLDFDKLSDVWELITDTLSDDNAKDYIDKTRINAIADAVQQRVKILTQLAMTHT